MMNNGDIHNTDTNHSLLDCINDDSIWRAFIQRKESVNPDDPDVNLLKSMFNDEKCRSTCEMISSGDYRFSIPVKNMIPKGNSGKMRTIYQFKKDEMITLKIIADQLYQYDWLFSDNLYSFRRNVHVGSAIKRLFSVRNLKGMWGYKADIHNYFNSIPVEILLDSLKSDLSDDKLFEMFRRILSDDRVRFKGEIIDEQKGVMAGIPISAFLANYYLKDVDEQFSKMDCIYMRYADDILILSKSKDSLMEFRDVLLSSIKEKGLDMNPKKEFFFTPGEKFDFLGFQISEECIDISTNTIHKMKDKIRRSSRKIRRWMLKKNAPVEGTIRALIRCYNETFYGRSSGELSWGAWYFTTITTSKSLHEIDIYFQDWIRYVATGRHSKKNHAIVSYDLMRSCGYVPLVSEYFNFRGDHII